MVVGSVTPKNPAATNGRIVLGFWFGLCVWIYDGTEPGEVDLREDCGAGVVSTAVPVAADILGLAPDERVDDALRHLPRALLEDVLQRLDDCLAPGIETIGGDDEGGAFVCAYSSRRDILQVGVMLICGSDCL